MKNLFAKVDPKHFKKAFSTEDQCLAFLSDQKWHDGFVCRKCGNENYCAGKKTYSRRCTRCKTEESATSHTVMHGCKIPITTAFELMYNVCSRPNISSHELSRLLNTRQMTCWKFKKKLMECLKEKDSLLIG